MFMQASPDGDLRLALAAEPMNTPFFIGDVCLNAYLRGLQPLPFSENNCDADPVWLANAPLILRMLCI